MMIGRDRRPQSFQERSDRAARSPLSRDWFEVSSVEFFEYILLIVAVLQIPDIILTFMALQTGAAERRNFSKRHYRSIGQQLFYFILQLIFMAMVAVQKKSPSNNWSIGIDWSLKDQMNHVHDLRY